MAQVVASYQVSAFVTPSNATTADADQVRGNDNTLRAALNSHDGESGLHFQSSDLADRPAAGTVGRKWLTLDDGRVYYDDGSNWLEVAYVRTANPVFTGTVTVSGLTATGTITGSGGIDCTSLTASGLVTINGGSGLALNAGLLSCASGNLVFRNNGSGSITIDANSVTGAITFQTNAAARWTVRSTGHFTANTDNLYDIGQSGVNRPRHIYAAGTITAGSTITGGTLSLNAGATLLNNVQLVIASLQVVGTRRGGYTAATGTATRTSFATSTVTLEQLAQRVKALIDDLLVHGLIGA